MAAALVPLHAADLGPQPPGRAGIEALPQRKAPEARDRKGAERKLAEYCFEQRHVCRKLCGLRSRFERRVDGCAQSCDSREVRCARTGCYKWAESELVLGEAYGAHRCALRPG